MAETLVLMRRLIYYTQLEAESQATRATHARECLLCSAVKLWEDRQRTDQCFGRCRLVSFGFEWATLSDEFRLVALTVPPNIYLLIL